MVRRTISLRGPFTPIKDGFGTVVKDCYVSSYIVTSNIILTTENSKFCAFLYLTSPPTFLKPFDITLLATQFETELMKLKEIKRLKNEVCCTLLFNPRCSRYLSKDTEHVLKIVIYLYSPISPKNLRLVLSYFSIL